MSKAIELQETAASLVRTILVLPEEERRRAMAEKLREFARMDPLERAASMRSVLDQIARLAPEERKSFLRARNQAFLDLPIGTRMALTGTRVEVLENLSAERRQEEVEALESLASDPDPQRQTVLKQLLTTTRGAAGTRVESTSIGRPSTSKKRWWKVWQ